MRRARGERHRAESGRRSHRGARRIALLTALCALVACADEPVDAPAAARLSLLSVGDLGTPAAEDETRARLRVGDALAAEDRRLPIDALVLLGDNFYPDGLGAHELVPRIAENVVAPLCHFLALDGPRSPEVEGACGVPRDARHPVPVHATLGNHDYGLERSPELQRRVVPEFVPRFRVPSGLTEVIEIAPGVSLVLLETQKIYEQPEANAAWVTDALLEAKGPWRIVAAHHPPLPLDDGNDFEFMTRGGAAMREAVAAAGVPVQLWLAGHEHNLQLLEGPGLGASLVVIAGSGSDLRSPESHPQQRFARKEHGFARVDWVGPDGAEQLVVTLFVVPDEVPIPVARAAVDVEGRAVPAPAPDAGSSVPAPAPDAG